MDKTLPSGYKHSLKICLNRLRNLYNLYDEDEKEVIDAIHIIQEELEYNIKDED